MGVSDFKLDAHAGPVVDLSAQGIQKLGSSFTCSDETHTLILDRNNIMKLDYLERCPGLQQLSVGSNRLVRMMGVSGLAQLRVLNLPSNSIGYIEGLRDLPHLEWLNLSGNNIKVIEQLHNCISLQHLDLSDNNISTIGDLTKLLALKTLLLHGNSLTTLRTVPAHLPTHLSILSLAENEIRDLNEASYLAPLQELEQLSVMSNPCVMTTPGLPVFDYRPYVMSWCLRLKVLDGFVVSQKESLKSEWLYSQGKGRSYRPGEHVQLVQYLATVCPLTSSPALETAEDAKLEKILCKQRLHQMQLLQQTQGMGPRPPRPTQLDVETLSPQHSAQQPPVAEENRSAPAGAVLSAREMEPTVQYNTWMRSDPFPQSGPLLGSPGPAAGERLRLEDVQPDEDEPGRGALSSARAEPQGALSESEDETEAFEPDSLAPDRPAICARRPERAPPQELQTETESEAMAGYHDNASVPPVGLPAAAGAPPDGAEAEADRAGAAVRIQAWWRGQYARHYRRPAREVRSEIRLRRMQQHIVLLSGELERMQGRYEEERLQRMVQEEAVKFLWKQLQSVQRWQQTVERQLGSTEPRGARPAQPALGPSPTEPPAHTDTSLPDSGFQSTCEGPAAPEDRLLSSGSPEPQDTVRAMAGSAGDRGGCSLLEQYLSSVQQQEEEEEEEEEGSEPAECPRPPSPPSPSKAAARPEQGRDEDQSLDGLE